MLTAILITAALAATPEPMTSSSPGKYLILTNGQKIRVKSVAIDGRLARVVTPDGKVFSLRADTIDDTRTTLVNERIATEDARLAELVEIQRVVDESERQAREAKDARTRSMSGGAGGLSVASELGTVPPSRSLPTGGASAEPAPAATSGGSWASRIAAIRSRYATAKATAARLVAEDERLTAEHNASSNAADRDVLRTKIAAVEREAEAAGRLLPGIRAEYAEAVEAARRSGADAAEWRGGIE